jgi:uncharacterized protein YndB with AHSA1/START domain
MSKPQSPFSLELSRRIPAFPDAVYRAWADPEQFKRWFKPTYAIMNVAIDGLWYLRSPNHEGREWPHYGRYLELSPARRLRFTWVSEATEGRESIVTVDLTPDGDGTRIVLSHENLPDNPLGRQHEQGWAALIGVIADGLASGGLGS